MKNSYLRPSYKRKIKIKGPCLLLFGPIGTFFARLLKYFEANNIPTYKIAFPLQEYGFPESSLVKYSDDINNFKQFLRALIIKKKIKHIFMYGNFIIPHRQALSLAEEFEGEGKKIYTHIFELGYFRPNFITLENRGINYESEFLLDRDFYLKQKSYKNFPIPKKYAYLRIRKFWKAITFINHCFKNYKIVEFDHKLQPKPSFLWFQVKGFLLKYFFRFSEIALKKKIFTKPFFIVILQVSTDSQLTKGSEIKNNEDFIYKVIKDFADSKIKNTNLVFKHHPRDRGYNNYSKQIKRISEEFNVSNNISYIHDIFLSKIFKNKNCKGTVLINSTVGYQSLFHAIPLKAIGISPYNIPGLVDQESLISFFIKPKVVDKLLFSKFYRYLMENSQINGNFDGFFPFDSVFIFNDLTKNG